MPSSTIAGSWDEACALCPCTVDSFDQERILHFVRCFFSLYREYPLVLVLLLMYRVTLTDLRMLTPCSPLGRGAILFMDCGILLACTLLRILASVFTRELVYNSPFRGGLWFRDQGHAGVGICSVPRSPQPSLFPQPL